MRLIGRTWRPVRADAHALINQFRTLQILGPAAPGKAEDAPAAPNLNDIKGQETAKRAGICHRQRPQPANVIFDSPESVF